jgi:transposase-like protein
MKEQLPKQVYTNEYRAQAVLMVTRDGLSIAEAARRLSMSLKTLANWVERARDGQLPAAMAVSVSAWSPKHKPRSHDYAARTPNCGWSATS